MQHDDERYYSLVRISRALALGIQNKVDERTSVNCLMNGIFKLPSIRTGLASQEALKLPSNKRTKEHFYGRTASAQRLIKELLENPNRSDKAFVAFLKSRSRVHYVTGAENMALRSYMDKNPTATWREAYRECCSELVRYEVKTRKKYVYMVDDIVYNNLKEVATKFGISVQCARNRFFKAKKYPNWVAKEV